MIVLKQFLAKIGRFSFVLELKAVEGMDRFISTMLLNTKTTRQSKHCGFSIYIFHNSKSKLMVMLVRAKEMVLSGLVFARKIARMILIQII